MWEPRGAAVPIWNFSRSRFRAGAGVYSGAPRDVFLHCFAVVFSSLAGPDSRKQPLQGSANLPDAV
jgi:hypothetical protein